jgi:hypothetical protein
METKKEVLKAWKEATSSLATYFANRYFGKDSERWWVSDEIGGVFYVNDYFFNSEDMVGYLEYKYTAKEMFDYYQYRLDLYEEQGSPLNIKTYKRLNKKNVSK